MNLYRHFNIKGELLYVGISIDVPSRLTGHKKHKSCWYNDIRTITIEPCPSISEARKMEKEAVIKERPMFNKVHHPIWTAQRAINPSMTKHNLKLKKQAEKRARFVAKLRNSGKKFTEIGATLEITPERARQLYAVATALKNVE